MKLLRCNAVILPGFLLFFQILSFQVLPAQQSDLIFEKVLDDHGKSIGYITEILQDQEGFIWLSTVKGLYRYDGYELKSYKNVSGDLTSLPHNSIDGFYIDSAGVFWLFCRFNDDRLNTLLTFNPAHRIPGMDPGLFANVLLPVKIVEDRSDHLWIATAYSGVHKFNKNTWESEVFSRSPVYYNDGLLSLIDSLSDTGPVIAEITGVTDRQHLCVSFSVDTLTPVIIVTLGESNSDGVYDYGFLTDDRDTVWKMEHAQTMHAGGVIKNRIQVLYETLEQGDYTLHYVSDDSHATGSWNGPPPTAMNFYGAKIFRAEEGLTGIIQEYLQDSSDNYRILSDNVRDIQMDDSGKIWILTYQGIAEYDTLNNRFITHEMDFKKVFGDKGGYEGPRYFLVEGNRVFIINFDRELISYNVNSQEIKVLSDTLRDRYGTGFFPLEIGPISRDFQGNLLFASERYVSILDSVTLSLRHYRNNENELYNGFKKFIQDNHSTYFITSYEGLNKARERKFLQVNLFDVYYHNFLKHCHLDDSGILWFYNTEDNQFKGYNISGRTTMTHHFSDSYIQECIGNFGHGDLVSFLFEDSRNNLWLAIGCGLFCFDRISGKITDRLVLPENTGGTNEIIRIFEDRQGNLWVFTISGMYRFNDESKNLEYYAELDFLNDSPGILRRDNIDFMYDDGNQTLWIRTYCGLFNFNISEKRASPVALFDDAYYEGLHRGNIFVDENGMLWMATFKDLFRINPLDTAIVTYSLRDEYRENEWDPGYRYYSIHAGSGDMLWISTGFGLIRFDRESEELVIYDEEDGLVGTNIIDYVIDERGMIWLATNEGISRFDPRYETFTYYTQTFSMNVDTKIEHQYINSNVLPDGKVLFFTTYGIVTFDPDNYNRRIPPLSITKFSLFDQEFETDTLIYLKNWIRLKHDQNFFSFEFAALDFHHPDLNRYMYRLEGLDRDWIACDADHRIAAYTDVAPGTYLFRVKGSNSDGVWNEEGASIQIVITPPWYRTTLAYILYGILFIVLMFLIIRLRESKLRKRNEQLEQKVTERTEEIMNQKHEIELQRDVLFTQKVEITNSINYAQRIQAAVLPDDAYLGRVLPEYFVLYKPKDIVSGDFYWVKDIENYLIIVAADCTGHGVPGAFMSMLGITLLNELAIRSRFDRPGQILGQLRTEIKKLLDQKGRKDEQKDGINMAMVVVDTGRRLMHYAGAYSPLYVYLRSGGEAYRLMELKGDRQPIGIHIDETDFTTHSMDLGGEETIYLFSDGFVDQLGGISRKRFKTYRFKELLGSIQDKPMNEQKTILERQFEHWRGNVVQIDDVCVLGVRLG